MSCLTSEQFELLVQGGLDPDTSGELLRHIAGCSACRSKLNELAPNQEVLRTLNQHAVLLAPPAEMATETLPGAAIAVSALPSGAGAASLNPDSIPGYQIIGELAREGQGVVYRAIQKATKRKVAIKVMKEGPFAGKADRARFEREVEILGLLSHPNIVGVHDSGEVGGCFYFVMDYISGERLDHWMTAAPRSIEETLRLFQKICEAVNAAHLKGVIHRDLKPGNIRIDDSGAPHVLDFGLAKVAHGVEDAALMTLTGQFMGSLPWASPEQAEAKPGKIDLRTDVYSLGVILYQMLTGKFPYEVVGNMRDVLDRIMRAEPTRPSTIRRQINDEVETIVLRCLQKERERRYQSAGELARDIGHYLAGEPIEAKRDSALYVLRKQIRRYRVPVSIAGVFLAVVVGFAAAMSILAARNAELASQEHEARAVSVDALTQANAERERADQKASEAITARDQAEYAAYLANITAADACLRNHEVEDLRNRLNACPDRLRGWEWQFLNAQADHSLHAMDMAPTDPLAALEGDQSISLAGLCTRGLLTFDQTGRLESNADAWPQLGGRLLGVDRRGDRWLVQLPDGGDTAHINLGIYDVRKAAITAQARLEVEIPAEFPLRGRPYEDVRALISPDGSWVAAACGEWVRILLAADMSPWRTLPSSVHSAICCTADSSRLAVSGYESIAVWEIDTGARIGEHVSVGGRESARRRSAHI